jgi:hypothetical protein
MNKQTDKISDGYHTFGELYEHRNSLFIALCKTQPKSTIWRSKLHSDGTGFDGWFLLGIHKNKGKQITYHLPISKWDETHFAKTLDKAPTFDGHTSADTLKRLREL